jgi:hypothetical protein
LRSPPIVPRSSVARASDMPGMSREPPAAMMRCAIENWNWYACSFSWSIAALELAHRSISSW